MTPLAAILALLLPALLGTAAVVAAHRGESSVHAPGFAASAIGAGIAIGAFAATLVLRALALASVPYGFAATVVPVAVLAAGTLALAWRAAAPAIRGQALACGRGLLARDLAGWARVGWFALLAWIALHAILLLAEVCVRPMYPWDAWSAWATKAKTWSSLGMMVPFGDADAWRSAMPATWFDARPGAPATVPLLQVWMATALGRWDDSLANLVWWLCYIAIVLAVAGETRQRGASAAAALVAAWFVASLPLLDAQVALAGYADLPLAMFFTVGALAALRAASTRSRADIAVAVIALLAAATSKETAWTWIAVVAPGCAAAALGPRAWRRIAVTLGVIAIAVTGAAARGANLAWTRGLLAFDPIAATFAAESLLYANWHLLGVGLVLAALLGRRRLLAPDVAPLGFVLLAGALWVAALVAFPALRYLAADALGIQRVLLVLAPLAIVWIVDASGVGRAPEMRPAPDSAG